MVIEQILNEIHKGGYEHQITRGGLECRII